MQIVGAAQHRVLRLKSSQQSQSHAAKECDVLAFGFIDEHLAHLFHMHVSATCKSDYYLEESTETAQFLVADYSNYLICLGVCTTDEAVPCVQPPGAMDVAIMAKAL